ncbi:hypothetical protein A2X44_02610 [candidate division CPR3 bacterium GWF2_35_18]|uniref:Uncharacterized protein n=1 Tax=candidate division CPR3 bacterium GW2011_GWF2_35_18 TaxID=1618350 RepID=A0A0G0BZH0_UNCC3|nr:MAG: hypothetical protein UR67_C0008G0012 [candidate division CPR3 bacterium GW2011_GWF2_35_18]OGB62484.1 MAG: hypothetical protein A2X44_02610 [candidate division CPR3 bacterium GWF2_35_18]OGB65528.1 MAG: hypothetical protein A2250_04190 [candidate division CPR3 bacterium RIFOXYA2_FULL_35_13]OGB79437.1 MAG: hypothetical protein A2296_03415 [candidate division CPR3 bacterium RIFOXYB2_FULL_35_8]
MSEVFSGVEKLEALKFVEEKEQREILDQIEVIAPTLQKEGVMSGVIVDASLGGSNIEMGQASKSNLMIVGLEKDTKQTEEALQDHGYGVESVSVGDNKRLSISKEGSQTNGSCDIVFGNMVEGNIVEVKMGDKVVRLRVSEESIGIGGVEVPVLYIVSEDELEQAYIEALGKGDFAEVKKLQRILQQERIDVCEEKYKLQLGENQEGKAESSTELLKQPLMDEQQLQEARNLDVESWQEFDFEYTYPGLQGLIISEQRLFLEKWEEMKAKYGDRVKDKMSMQELYNLMYEDGYFDDLEEQSDKVKILGSIGQIQGTEAQSEYSQEDAIILLEQVMLESVSRNLGKTKGDKRVFSLLVRTRKFETANASGVASTSKGQN